MFSNKGTPLSSLPTLGMLLALTPHLKKKGSALRDDLLIGDKQELQDAVRYLQNLHNAELFALSRQYPRILSVCRNEPALKHRWAARLAGSGYMDFTIRSWENHTEHSLFDELMSGFLLAQYAAWKEKYPNELPSAAEAILDAACEFGSYYALNERMNIHSSLLFVPDMRAFNAENEWTDPRLQSAAHALLKDAEKISSLYWSTGCMTAAQQLFRLAGWYADNPSERQRMEQIAAAGQLPDTETDWPGYLHVLITSLDYFSLSFALQNHPESVLTNGVLLKDEPVMMLFSADADSWREAKNLLLEQLSSAFRVPNPDALLEQEIEIAAIRTDFLFEAPAEKGESVAFYRSMNG